MEDSKIEDLLQGKNAITDDYFQEKMRSILKTDRKKDGSKMKFLDWFAFVSPIKDGKGSIRFFDFIEELNFNEINSENLIYEYKIDGKTECRIYGIHQLVVNRLVDHIIPNFYKTSKRSIRELKLKNLLD